MCFAMKRQIICEALNIGLKINVEDNYECTGLCKKINSRIGNV